MSWDTAFQRPEPDTTPAPVAPPSADTPYAQVALDGELATMRAAGKGTRNDTLNTCAFKLGGLVAGGALSESDVVSALTEAAMSTGLGEREIAGTLRSGLESGKREPRGVPEREPRNSEVATGRDYAAEYAAQFAEIEGEDVPADPEASDDNVHTHNTVAAKRFRLLDRTQLWEPLPEPVYVVDGIIRQASVVEIAAYGGSSKTWLAVDAALSVAAGIPWLGRFGTLQGSTCFVDYESGQYEILRRLQAVARARGLERVDAVDVASLPSVYMPDPAFGAAVTELATGRSLIAIDTLKAATPGLDENDANMRSGLDVLRRAAEATGCAFLVLVHTKKKRAEVTVDAREMGRGSSAIFDAADSVLHLEYREGHPQRVSQTKARLGRVVDPFNVTVTDTEGGGVLVEAHDATDGITTDSFNAKCRKLLELVQDNPGASGRLIRERSGMRPSTALAALESLERAGAVVNRGTVKAAAWHYVSALETTPHWSDDL